MLMMWSIVFIRLPAERHSSRGWTDSRHALPGTSEGLECWVFVCDAADYLSARVVLQ